jgi:hypothetical protein
VIYYAAIPISIFIVVLQVAAAPSFTYLGVHADLPVAWLGCWAAARGRREMLPLVGVTGLALGLLGREPLGASVLALLPLAGLAVLDESPAIVGRFVTALLVVFVGGVMFAVIHALTSFAGGEGFGSPLNVLRIAPRAAVLDVMTAALWYWPVGLFFGRHTRAGEFRRM